MIFFLKQKTAYEMRISDWSSDVCSSDLPEGGRVMGEQKRRRAAGAEDLRLQGPKPGGFRLFAAFERWMAKDTPWRGEPGEFGRRQRERAFERRLDRILRTEEHTSALQSLQRSAYAVLCLEKTNKTD